MKLRQPGLRLLRRRWSCQAGSPLTNTGHSDPSPAWRNKGFLVTQRAEKSFTTIQPGFNSQDGMNNLQNRGGSCFPGFLNIEQHRQKIAITDQTGDYMYEDIYLRSWDLAKAILGLLDGRQQQQVAAAAVSAGEADDAAALPPPPPTRIAVLCDTGLAHVVTAWACWMLGSAVVPLPVDGSAAELEHIVRHTGAGIIIASQNQSGKVHALSGSSGAKLISLDSSWWKGPQSTTESQSLLPNPFLDASIFKEQTAMIVYTSGRMGVPRGISLSHTSLETQIKRVVDSWEISSEDTLLHCLNLHQVYGLVNGLYAPLSQRARVLTVNSFQESGVWSHLLGMSSRGSTATTVTASRPVTLFPGTPAIFHKLILKAEEIFKDKKSREYVKTTCAKKIRLMTSAESALPTSLQSQWAAITGHRIMNNLICTEVGTVLNNRLQQGSTSQQGPACFGCGVPVQGVQIKLVRFRDETRSTYDTLSTHDTENAGEDTQLIGELLLRGEDTAQRMWKDGGEEKLKLYDDGWFLTGDIGLHHEGVYHIKGKLGVKQVKVDGKDVSLPELERTLLKSADINDVTVVSLGAPHSEQRIAALLVINKTRKVTLENILEWCNENLQPETVPTVLKIVETIPRDTSGRLDKRNIFKAFPDVPFICFQETIL